MYTKSENTKKILEPETLEPEEKTLETLESLDVCPKVPSQSFNCCHLCNKEDAPHYLFIGEDFQELMLCGPCFRSHALTQYKDNSEEDHFDLRCDRCKRWTHSDYVQFVPKRQLLLCEACDRSEKRWWCKLLKVMQYFLILILSLSFVFVLVYHVFWFQSISFGFVLILLILLTYFTEE